VCDSKIDLIAFEEDALVFTIGVTKIDQESTLNIDHLWHVYSNPRCPELFSMLAMGQYLMCNPSIVADECSLF
jgi:hypothetical protein